MKLTTKGRYAVMAIADIARHGPNIEGHMAVSLSDISLRQGISLAYLEQLFVKLRRAGLVQSHRGAKGGYVLNLPVQDLTVDMIIHAVDEDIKAHGCDPKKEKSCTGMTARCLTHNLWGALETHIETFLSAVSIHDVIEGDLPSLTPLEPVNPAQSSLLMEVRK